MLKTWWEGWATWWSTVSPEFAFRLALPFAIVALALLADLWKERRRRSLANPKAVNR